MSETGTLSVRNFERYQHYKDRTPPWIKLYNDVLDDYRFERLQDASKAHLILIWLLASRTNNRIPNDPEWIARKIGATEEIDLQALIEAEFIVDNQDGKQLASKALDLARSREGEGEGEESREDYVSKETLVNANGVDRTERIPIRKAFENYNIVAGDLGLSRAEKLTPERERKLRSRLQEHGIDGWNRALTLMGEQPFLLGRNNKGWRAGLDFLLQPQSLNKVLEGQYADEGAAHD